MQPSRQAAPSPPQQGADLVDALQLATRDLLGLALHSLDRVGVASLPQMRLLFAVHEVGPAAGVVLARRLGVSAASVSRHAERLGKAGYLARGADPANRSVVRFNLTPAGHDVVKEVLDWRAEVFRQLVQELDPVARTHTADGLRRLHRAIRRHGIAGQQPVGSAQRARSQRSVNATTDLEMPSDESA